MSSSSIAVRTVAASASVTRVRTLWKRVCLSPVAQFYAATVFATLLGLTAGAIVTSGFNLATALARVRAQGSCPVWCR